MATRQNPSRAAKQKALCANTELAKPVRKTPAKRKTSESRKPDGPDSAETSPENENAADPEGSMPSKGVKHTDTGEKAPSTDGQLIETTVTTTKASETQEISTSTIVKTPTPEEGLDGKDLKDPEFSPPSSKRRRQAKPKKPELDENGNEIPKVIKPRAPKSSAKLGFTPYPDHAAPSAEQCYEVNRRLGKAHGLSERPETIIVDNSVSGCGEVPHVLDALLRTILSAATTNSNSARAFQGVIERFGLVDEEGNAVKGPIAGADDKKESFKKEAEATEDKEGGVKDEDAVPKDHGDAVKSEVAENQPRPLKLAEDDINEQLFVKAGLGTVNWNAVRLAPVSELREAIWRGGLADSKSKNIKTILDMVFEQNMPKTEAEGKSENQITLDFLASLDYLCSVKDDEEVREKLQSFPGVGLKTATCVMCMCLGRDVFAVDTHVLRLAKFLSWIPPKADHEKACFHLDLRIPNELKYSLHNLFIRHGRSCAHCKGGPASKTTEEKTSPTQLKRKVKKEEAVLDEDGKPVKVKRTKKVWTGNGLMKQTLVEVDTEDEGGEEEEGCCLEDLVTRERKARKEKKVAVQEVVEEVEEDAKEEEEEVDEA